MTTNNTTNNTNNNTTNGGKPKYVQASRVKPPAQQTTNHHLRQALHHLNQAIRNLNAVFPQPLPLPEDDATFREMKAWHDSVQASIRAHARVARHYRTRDPLEAENLTRTLTHASLLIEVWKTEISDLQPPQHK